jgi:phosphoglycolate phosphatase-like HAD superfamily hydrolase
MRSLQPKDPAPETFAAKTERPVFRVVLFDIDGTLVLTGGAGGRAMTLAFEECFGVPKAFHGTPMPGRTDSWILSAAATAHGIPPDQLPRFHDAYLSHLTREIHEPGPRKGVMPGVRPLLDALASRPDVYLALLTGNYERSARLKLEYFDLWRYFRAGAFGDDAPDRNALVAKALLRIRTGGGPSAAPADAVVIGDTPLDVMCASVGGARSVAVATGDYDADSLRQAGADIVFEDLSDTSAVLQAILQDFEGGRPDVDASGRGRL